MMLFFEKLSYFKDFLGKVKVLVVVYEMIEVFLEFFEFKGVGLLFFFMCFMLIFVFKIFCYVRVLGEYVL